MLRGEVEPRSARIPRPREERNLPAHIRLFGQTRPMASHTDKTEYTDDDGTHVEKTETEVTSSSTESLPDGSGSDGTDTDADEDTASGGSAD